MTFQEMIKKIRLSLVRLPAVGYGPLPEVPAYILRDLWTGDSVYGMHLVKGEYIYQDYVIPLYPGQWGDQNISCEIEEKLHGFSWLRDMRELGTENARLVARNLVIDWIGNSPSFYGSTVYRPVTLANRVANWLGFYDFFAASAERYFHQQFMRRMMKEGRYLVAMLPLDGHTHESFTVLKAVLALALCMPEQFDLIPKISKLLQNELAAQILEDGIQIERNPEIQLYVLRDLTEIRLMYQLVNIRSPSELPFALDTVSRALRALRHGDGRLALFNGSSEEKAYFIDRVLTNSTQKRVAMTDMKAGGYIRCFAHRSTLLIDSGVPPKKVVIKYLGALSFEFSVGKQRLIVNCGAGGSSAWRSALAGTAAHSVLKLCNAESVSLGPDQVADVNFKVESLHEMTEGAHWVELSHNGWQKSYDVIYHRKFYLSADGQDLRGEEILEFDQSYPFTIRFHLHPSVKVEEKWVAIQENEEEKIFILSFQHPQEGDQVWWFRFSGAEGKIENSVYFGEKVRLATKQIVLYNLVKPKNSNDEENNVSSISSEQQKQHSVMNEIQNEKESDYVAIFHNQNSHAKIRQQDVPDYVLAGMFEDLPEKHSEIQELSKLDKPLDRSEKEPVQDDKGVYEEVMDDSVRKDEERNTKIRWALRRKV